MFKTVEIRWFFNKPVGEVEKIFKNITSETRIDSYALTTDEKNGIKIREGNLEIKVEIGQRERVGSQEISGEIQQWQKWGANFIESEIPEGVFLKSAGWCDVVKSRALINYELKDDSFKEEPVLENIEEVGRFEYTKLGLNGGEYCTVAFETFGQGDLRKNLRKLVQYIAIKHPEIRGLTFENSYSYPKWLKQTL